MYYAIVDDSGRVHEWTDEGSRPFLDAMVDGSGGAVVEFSNGEFLQEVFAGSLDDFIIRDGLCFFEPLAENVARREMQSALDNLPQTLAESSAAMSDLSDQQDAYESDTDAALFDIVDYIEALEARIAALEA